MPHQQETEGRFNLVTGEDTYSGQSAQNPATARRLQSLIPSLDGQLTREAGENLYLPQQLNGVVGQIFQYDFTDNSGVRQTKFFAATPTSLYMNVAGAWVIQSIPHPSDDRLTTTTPFTDYPSFVIINNLLHFSDGNILDVGTNLPRSSWLYDGPNAQFVKEGFPIPSVPPSVDYTNAGSLNATIGINYWYTFSDQTVGRVHESSSSPIQSATEIPLVNINPVVSINPGTVVYQIGGTLATGTGTNFGAGLVGLLFYVNGILRGTITGFSTLPQTLTIVPNDPPGLLLNGLPWFAAPKRATHFNIYKSETDGSKLGKFVASVPIPTNPMTFTDSVPFQNQSGSTILNIDRPIRNDPPVAAKIQEVHKYRVFRNRPLRPNFFNFTANEEVSSGANGAPQESSPGTNKRTLSDIINEFSYPKQSNRIQAIKSHADALYIGTETEIIPLYGQSIDDFGLSQVTAVDGGVCGRFGLESTSHGLVIFSYDRKLYLYPPVSPIFSLTPKDINITDSLVEIGRPMRKKFLTILGSDLGNVRTLKYRYNQRDWLVVCYQDSSNIYHTYIYDFETKGWFELQRGFASVGIFETSPGIKILVGGGTDGFVYVVDDVTGVFSPAPTLPSAIFRTALIDFGAPDSLHLPEYLEIEVSNVALMDSSTTVNFYLDPQDADNPGTPIPLTMSPEPGTNFYRGYFAAAQAGQGVLCRRLMVELNLTSDANAGSFRGIVLKASPVQPLFR